MAEYKIHRLDPDILNALLQEGRVTPGYLQKVLRNRSSYVRQRLRELVHRGYVRYLGHGLYEPVRPRIEQLWSELLRREQAADETQMDPWEKVAMGLSLGLARRPVHAPPPDSR